jgi:hypothetical protein
MAKFNVTATILTTMTINRQVDANNMQEATIKVLKESRKDDWKVNAELKTTSK